MNLMKRIVATLVLVASVAVIPLPAMAATSNGARGTRVVRLALSYLGRPYVFGATGPRSFDCSGFTRYVMARAVGIRLPRTSRSQATVGRRIARAALQPGDLVFFENTWRRGVSHVGIAMGDGRMVHAFPRRGVTIDRLSHSYLASRYYSSRTVLR